MITPRLLTPIYWASTVYILVYGVIILSNYPSRLGFEKLVGALVFIVPALIVLRITCEIILILFNINDNLQKIADKN
ncbi:DUF4282 domain-containing protein [Alteromonas genovensis]